MHDFIENCSCTLDSLIVMILNIRYFLGVYQIEKLWYFLFVLERKEIKCFNFSINQPSI